MENGPDSFSAGLKALFVGLAPLWHYRAPNRRRNRDTSSQYQTRLSLPGTGTPKSVRAFAAVTSSSVARMA